MNEKKTQKIENPNGNQAHGQSKAKAGNTREVYNLMPATVRFALDKCFTAALHGRKICQRRPKFEPSHKELN